MVDISIDNCSREEARSRIINLPRNRQFHVETLKDGRKIYVRTDGEKKSHEGAEEKENLDITIHYDGEKRGLNYIDDFFVDLIRKREKNPKEIDRILNAIKDSIELVSYSEIEQKYPNLGEGLPGESVEFLLKVIKWMALQEDINYWGINPKSKKPFEGRNKPINALNDYFRKNMPLRTVIIKHRL